MVKIKTEDWVPENFIILSGSNGTAVLNVKNWKDYNDK